MLLDRLIRLQVCHRLLEEAGEIGGAVLVCDERGIPLRSFGSQAIPSCLEGTGARCLPTAKQQKGWIACTAGGEHRVLGLVPDATHLGWILTAALERAALEPAVLHHLERLLAIVLDEMRAFLKLGAPVIAPTTPPIAFPELLGDSAPIRAVGAEIRRALDVPFPVLIEGETGTGKDLAAWLIHDRGQRRSGPYVTLNCVAMPEGLIESELFGHRRGSFSGADRDRPGLLMAARGGSLFLDEVGELSQGAQAKLLRAMDTGEVLPIGADKPERTDARIIAATNVDLDAAVKAGRFRRDLYYRLRVLYIHLPALRERPEDVPLLARHTLESVCTRLRIPQRYFSRSAMAAFIAARWPGNIRQLIHEVERAVVSCDDAEIQLPHLSPEFQAEHRGSDLSFLGLRRRVIEVWERAEILRGLERTNWNVAALAQEIGLSKRALFERVARYGFERPASPGA